MTRDTLPTFVSGYGTSSFAERNIVVSASMRSGDVRKHLLLVVAAGILLLSPFCCYASAPLDCAAMGSLEDPETYSAAVVIDQIQEDDGYYAIGTNDPNGDGSSTPEPYDAMPSALVKTQPPSMAPSMAQPCSDPHSNARGQYTSTLAPCVVKFHNANIQRESQETSSSQLQQKQEEAEFIDYRTSDLCHDDNVIIEIKEYAQSWPDECVGDFERCYSLDHHFSLMCDFLCEKEYQYDNINSGGISLPSQHQLHHTSSSFSYRPHWELPEGTTHVSVMCTRDKELVLEQYDKEERAERDERRQAKRDELQTRLFNGLIVFVSALTIIYALSHLIVTPLVAVATAVASSGRNNGSTVFDDEDDDNPHCSHLSVRRSAENRRRRSSFLERRSTSSSISSLPVHHQEVEALVLEDDTLSHDIIHTDDHEEYRYNRSDTVVSSLHNSSGASHHRRPHMVEEDDDDSRSEDQAESDFDSQIPLDFDAVPIVTAQIVPATIMQAMALNDGITYS
jgi:hypothetical protein